MLTFFSTAIISCERHSVRMNNSAFFISLVFLPSLDKLHLAATTLRAIGAKKFDIYRMFIGEAVAITTLTSLPAMLLMFYAEGYLAREIELFEKQFYMPIPLLIASILVIYIFNIVISLIPVWNTMRKRPAAILARYDVD